ESDIIQSAFDYGDTKAKEVLTKRDDIFAVDINKIDQQAVIKLLNDCPYARIPVYEKNIDNIIGILHVRTFLREYLSNKKVSVRAILKKPYFVKQNAALEDIFEGFKKHRTHIAIVQGKDKETVGLLTMDDVLEELVGEFAESHPVKIMKKKTSSSKGGDQ
ncbi:MAG: CBS domain-containing protein, partial [Bacilli bacterium]|nr:CBS domain-containing protein [Bacilli bacterium]